MKKNALFWNRPEQVAPVGDTQGKRSNIDWWLCLTAMTLLPFLNWIPPHCRRLTLLSHGKLLYPGRPKNPSQNVSKVEIEGEKYLLHSYLLVVSGTPMSDCVTFAPTLGSKVPMYPLMWMKSDPFALW